MCQFLFLCDQPFPWTNDVECKNHGDSSAFCGHSWNSCNKFGDRCTYYEIDQSKTWFCHLVAPEEGATWYQHWSSHRMSQGTEPPRANMLQRNQYYTRNISYNLLQGLKYGIYTMNSMCFLDVSPSFQAGSADVWQAWGPLKRGIRLNSVKRVRKDRCRLWGELWCCGASSISRWLEVTCSHKGHC